MKNWRKLRILIVLYQICGKRPLDSEKKKMLEGEEKKYGCKERIAKRVINPHN